MRAATTSSAVTGSAPRRTVRNVAVCPAGEATNEASSANPGGSVSTTEWSAPIVAASTNAAGTSPSRPCWASASTQRSAASAIRISGSVPAPSTLRRTVAWRLAMRIIVARISALAASMRASEIIEPDRSTTMAR